MLPAQCVHTFIKNMQEKIRQWVIERDGHRCQHLKFIQTGRSQCFQTAKLEVHHIFSKRFMARWFPEETPDKPENMITLCEFHHHEVHPDVKDILNEGFKEYVSEFNSVFTKRDELVSQGKIYWQPLWDSIYHLVATKNTEKFSKKFPGKE